MDIGPIFKKIYNEFVYGDHLLSLGVSAILASYAILADQKISLALLLAGYCLGQMVYKFDHYKDLKKDSFSNPERSGYALKQKKYFIYFFTIYCLLFFVFLIYLNNFNLFLAIIFILTGGLFSSIVAKKITKKFPGFKNLYVAFFWAFCIVVAGASYRLNIFSYFSLLLFAFVFLRWLVNTTFFDIKDLDGDRSLNLKTFPVVFGKNNTLNYLQLINLVSFSPIIFGVIKGYLPVYSISLFFFVIYGFCYLRKAKVDKADIRFLSYVVADGEYLFWPAILILAKIF